MRSDSREIIGIVIHVVAFRRLRRSSVPAPESDAVADTGRAQRTLHFVSDH
jgi:hypothetical protein